MENWRANQPGIAALPATRTNANKLPNISLTGVAQSDDAPCIMNPRPPNPIHVLVCSALLMIVPALGLADDAKSTTAPPKTLATAAKSLFNGKDLKGWVKMHGGEWTVESGVIVGRKGVGWTTNPEKSGSWLRTEKEYSNFIFEFEYAINTKGNSGVFLRSALKKNPAFTGHEMQILDDHGRGDPKVWSTGALYDVVAASKNVSKPAGEWNQVRIETSGPRIRISLNGTQIIDYKSKRLTKGYLGLQNHDAKAVVKFRNLKITEL